VTYLHVRGKSAVRSTHPVFLPIRTNGTTQVEYSAQSAPDVGVLQVGPAQVGPTQVGTAQVGSVQVGAD